jgi:hypothetical protein
MRPPDDVLVFLLHKATISPRSPQTARTIAASSTSAWGCRSRR